MKAAPIALKSPLSDGDIRRLHVGDVISLTGKVYTMRDQASLKVLRLIDQGEEPPIPLGATIFHAGPAVDWSGDQPKVASIGPTTSARMNRITPRLMKELRIRCIVGKGGMDRSVLRAMNEVGCVYALAIGGCAAIYTSTIRRISRVIWREMGPEAVFELEVKEFGPLIVTMDASGQSLHAEIEEKARQRVHEIMDRLGILEG